MQIYRKIYIQADLDPVRASEKLKDKVWGTEQPQDSHSRPSVKLVLLMAPGMGSLSAHG